MQSTMAHQATFNQVIFVARVVGKICLPTIASFKVDRMNETIRWLRRAILIVSFLLLYQHLHKASMQFFNGRYARMKPLPQTSVLKRSHQIETLGMKRPL